jgi:hypothetical protein
MAKFADQKRIGGPTFQEGDMVYLLRHSRNEKQPNIKTNRPSDKLDFKKLGPYEVLKRIGTVNYEIDLPIQEGKRGRTVHPVFHISLLEKALVDEETGEIIRDEIVIQGEELEYEVESIVDIRPNAEHRREYLIKWKNYDEEHNSWEPPENLTNVKELLKHFHQKMGLKPQK